MTDSNKCENRKKMNKMNLRTLRISLKYRPEILKLIFKMRLCIQRKNVILKKLKLKLKQMKSVLTPIGEVTHSNHEDMEKEKKNIGDSMADQTLLENQTTKSMKESSMLTETLNETIDDSMANQSLLEKQTTPKCTKDSSTQTDSLNETIDHSNADQLLLENQIALISTKDLSTQTESLNETIDHSTAEQPLLENQTTPKSTNNSSTQIESLNETIDHSMADEKLVENQTTLPSTKAIQTGSLTEVKKSNKVEIESNSEVENANSEKAGWDIKNDEGEKSIAEQVKEVAQKVLQQTGMVYVESAGMYYDYKTGYYYNSELGLYYHTETGCYYYYSDEKQSFVFHSYPDRSAENTALAAHQKKKAKKHKKEQQKEVDINNLTKQMSQGEDEESSKPKRRKTSKKKDTKRPKKDVEDTKKDNPYKPETEIPIEKDKADETSGEKIEESNGSNGEKEDNQVNLELEDGECSETESDISSDEDCKSKTSMSTATDDESIAKHHPPCMRIIVRETNLTKLKVGNLFLITKDGGTIGREGDQHAIIINEHGVSRNHLEIKYDMGKRTYLATDLGSKNGTILNGIRMSESQDVSTSMEIMHGSTIQVGETKLLCHIHPGNDTCGHCEPGLIMETQEKQKVAYTRTCSVQKQHQLELARLKNKYAPKQLMINSVAYNDRAQARRDTIGSSHHAEKTQSSDLDSFIPAENKGFKLLEKMGWSKGEGLGKDNQGDTEPIPLVSNEGTSGLGAAAGSAPQPLPKIRITNTLGPATLRLAAKTKMLSKPAKAFQDQLDDEKSE